MKVIYKIVNKVNGKIYIGSTINYKRRIKVHLSRLDKNDHHSIKLQNSYNKYGIDNFEFEILEEVDDIQLLIEKEQKWIDALIPELNMTLVAGLNCHIGLKRSDETKKRISESLKGKKLSEEHKESVRKTLTGRKLSTEHKENIKNALNNSEKFKKSRQDKNVYIKIVNTKKENGYSITDETKSKISESLKKQNLQSAISITIEKYSLSGELLDTYPSMVKAEIDNNIGRGGLYYNIVKQNKTEYKGFLWKIIK